MEMEYLYSIGKLQEALATDERANTLEIKIVIQGGKIHLTGHVSTRERQEAIVQIIAELLPEVEIFDQLTLLELHQAGRPEAIYD